MGAVGHGEGEGMAESTLRTPSFGILVRLPSGFLLSASGKSSSKVQTTPNKPGGDRYIPHRSASQMEVASFLLSKENHPENSQTPTKKVCAPEGFKAMHPSVYFA